ncbi:MAG: hypothetical protein LIO77_01885 [Rikenellaceae bacterium]|nr:hypothetical protein [Rikenellaceae bacterium]
MLRAYIWNRWIIFCLETGNITRIFFPPLASIDPAVLFYLVRFVTYFAGKRGYGRRPKDVWTKIPAVCLPET